MNLGVFLTPFGTPGDMGLDPRFHCVGPYCLRWAALVPIPLSMDPTSPTEEVAVGRMIALGIGNPAHTLLDRFALAVNRNVTLDAVELTSYLSLNCPALLTDCSYKPRLSSADITHSLTVLCFPNKAGSVISDHVSRTRRSQLEAEWSNIP